MCIGAPSTMYLFRVPPSAGSVGTYLASQSSQLHVFFCCCICRRVFHFFLQNSHVHFILLLWANFCTKVSCTSMLLSSISYSRYCSTASTTLHITNGSQRRIASTCPSESDNASKQTELKSEYIVEHLYSTLRSQNEEMSNCIFRKPIQLHTHR